MSSNERMTFPPSPPQIDVTFPSNDPVPFQIEGKLTKKKGNWGAVICHPHPLHGGSMNNKVVDASMRAVSALGGTALRFNFRGVGKSEGAYGEGVGEVEDLLGAIAFLKKESPSLFPLWLIGFSFGTSVISLCEERASTGDGVILIAPPLDHVKMKPFAVPQEGIHMILGENDEYCNEEQLKEFREAFDSPDVSAGVIPGTNHFFHGHLPSLVMWMKGILQGERTGGFGAV